LVSKEAAYTGWQNTPDEPCYNENNNHANITDNEDRYFNNLENYSFPESQFEHQHFRAENYRRKSKRE